MSESAFDVLLGPFSDSFLTAFSEVRSIEEGGFLTTPPSLGVLGSVQTGAPYRLWRLTVSQSDATKSSLVASTVSVPLPQ